MAMAKTCKSNRSLESKMNRVNDLEVQLNIETEVTRIAAVENVQDRVKDGDRDRGIAINNVEAIVIEVTETVEVVEAADMVVRADDASLPCTGTSPHPASNTSPPCSTRPCKLLAKFPLP